MKTRQSHNRSSSLFINIALDSPVKHKNHRHRKKSKHWISNERKNFLQNEIMYNSAAFIEAVENIDSETYSANDLYYIVGIAQNNDQVKYASYLSLFRSGTLADLQRLAPLMDFNYQNSTGANAVLVACAYGREDILRWLVDDLEMSLAVVDNDDDGPVSLAVWHGRTALLHKLVAPFVSGGYGLSLEQHSLDSNINPVMRATYAQQFGLLRNLVTPLDDGGFGLSLDCRNEINYDLAMQAANDGHDQILAVLITPIDQGGFGFVIDKNILRNYPYSPVQTSIKQPTYVMTMQDAAYALTSVDTVNVLNLTTKHTDSYHVAEKLGEGGFGKVYRFDCDETGYSIAVKYFGEDWQTLDDYEQYIVDKKTSANEFKYLCKAYPEQGPYMLQEIRKIYNNKVHYAYRLAMPLVPGERIVDFCAKLTDAYDIALLFLRVAETVNALHLKGIIHGDIREGNILVEKNEWNDFSVQLIDFYFSRKIGTEIFTEQRDRLFAPESRTRIAVARAATDVWSLAQTFIFLLSKFPLTSNLKDELYAGYPVIEKFITESLNINPNMRPSLTNFSVELAKLIECEDFRALLNNSNTSSLRVG